MIFQIKCTAHATRILLVADNMKLRPKDSDRPRLIMIITRVSLQIAPFMFIQNPRHRLVFERIPKAGSNN